MPKALRKSRPETRRKTSLTLAPSVWDAIHVQAEREGRTLAMVVERALRAYLAAASKEVTS